MSNTAIKEPEPDTMSLAPVNTGLSIFDSGTFEQMGMIASKLATSSLIPQTLRAKKQGQSWIDLPPEQVAANCFRIVEQAQRWGMSPFAVVDCASVVHGKLMWEGKLVAAALEATMGIRLNYEYSGEGMSRKVIVSGTLEGESVPRIVEGTVADWKTEQWKASAHDQRLAYRGAREWARRHCPGAILGVYSPDEIDESEMRNATPRNTIKLREDYIPTSGEETPGEVVDEEPKNSDPNKGTREVTVVNVEVKKDIDKNDKPYTLTIATLDLGSKKIKATTFSTRVGTDIEFLQGSKAIVELEYNEEKKEIKLVSVSPVKEQPEGGLC